MLRTFIVNRNLRLLCMYGFFIRNKAWAEVSELRADVARRERAAATADATASELSESLEAERDRAARLEVRSRCA